jgi:tRNA (guanine-N7-)-methyltransferase
MSDPRAPLPSEDAALRERSIRSFVLRQGRLTPAQARAFDVHWARYGLEYVGAPRNFAEAFGHPEERRPLVLEIGTGNGEQLHFAAASDAARDYLGIEVHTPGVGRLLNAVADDVLTNVRVYRHDAVEVLKHEVADGALDEVRIYFPDPWPKKRQQKRRLVQSPLVELIAAKLRVGGLLHLATDWHDYAEQMLAVGDASPHFANRAGRGRYADAPAWRTETHFERRGKRLGHDVFDLIYERIAA